MTTPAEPPGPAAAPEQAPAASPPRRLSPLTPVVRGFYLGVAFVVTSWDNLVRGQIGVFGLLLLGLLVAGAVFGAVSWLRTTYVVERDELRVDTGLVSRRSRRIRVDRLQGVDVHQPFVARLLGVAELRFDVAAGGDEGALAYLPLGEAEALRATLLARRDVVRRARAGAPGPTGPAAPEPAVPDVVVARLDLGRLVVSIVLSSETFAFVFSALLVGGSFAFLGAEGVGGVAGLLTLVGGFLVAAVRRLSAFYDFTLTRTAAGLQVRRGLLDRASQTFVLHRVQGVLVTEPLLWRRMGWARLDVAQARQVHSEGGGSKDAFSSTVLPVAPRAEVLALAEQLLAASAGLPDGVGVHPSAVPLAEPPERARWVAPVRRHWLLGGVGEHTLVARCGLLTRRTHVVTYARVQSLRLVQRPWQRPWGLADLVVDSPPGPVGVRLRHRDGREARRLLEQSRERARDARRAAELQG